jgi:hypothetical protein
MIKISAMYVEYINYGKKSEPWIDGLQHSTQNTIHNAGYILN